MLRELLRVESDKDVLEVRAGQDVICHPGECVRYSTLEECGAEYFAVCLPAFSPDTVHRCRDNTGLLMRNASGSTEGEDLPIP